MTNNQTNEISQVLNVNSNEPVAGKKIFKGSFVWGLIGLLAFIVLGGIGFCPWYMWIFVALLVVITLSGLYKGVQIGLSIFVILFCTPVFSSEESSYNSSARNYSNNSTTSGGDLSRYQGKWVLFEQGMNRIGESTSFDMKISGSKASVMYYYCPGLGQNDIIYVDGEGQAELYGNTLTVYINRGKGSGKTYKFRAVDGKLYNNNGKSLSHSRF